MGRGGGDDEKVLSWGGTSRWEDQGAVSLETTRDSGHVGIVFEGG